VVVVTISLNLTHQPKDQHRHGSRSQKRVEHIPHFIGVDGEGVTVDDGMQNYVLLGVGDYRIDNPEGLSFDEIMSFLYARFRAEKTEDSVFVGFYLSYDFSHWIKQLPRGRAWSLLTTEGIATRARKNSNNNTVPFPIRYGNWEFDMLGMRRFKLRPLCCSESWKCNHKRQAWMYINDAGPFWQTSLLSAIDPRRWPEPIVTQEEYDALIEGKSRRAVALLDDDMRFYNRLENQVLARLMERLAGGLVQMGVRLSKDQWHGPGQAAAEWMRQQQIVRRRASQADVTMLEACRRSYLAGWFELFAHGRIPGDSFGYDLNSAYPYIMSTLPCLEHGKYNKGKGTAPTRGLVLIEGIVHGNNPYIGAMLHRTPEATICRPQSTRGVFWLHELEASQRAGLVRNWTVTRWWQYIPCDCPSPLANLSRLYNFRQSIGKDTAAGKAAKLIYNSAYGKFAQSIGSAPYGNWIYASLITSGCRVMILNAIATHPLGAGGCLMVATDGVFFSERHPGLPLSSKLGDWDETIKEDLFLFKPGFYWDAESKGKITYKSRGIRAADFSDQIPKIERQFDLITRHAMNKEGIVKPAHWPFAVFNSSFSMRTPLLALREGKWERVAEVFTDREMVQSSDPASKRVPLLYVDHNNSGPVLRTQPYEVAPGGIRSRPYDKIYADEKLPQFEDISPDGGFTKEWTIATDSLRGEK
jgi:hypothetical protein